MARIRSIKPEFPHSESMGRVSRDARLTFVELWTLADDAGRLRGNSRMLASLLFPYDDDAKGLIDGWLGELEREHCIQRYQIDGTSYVQVCNWLTHQKIDKPSQSKIPPFDESSRILSKPRERSSEDLRIGSGSGRDQGEEGNGGEAPAQSAVPPAGKPRKRKAPIPDDFTFTEELRQYTVTRLPDVDPAAFFESFRGKALAKGWTYVNWDQALQEFVRNCAPGSGHWASGQYPKINGSGKWF